MSTAEFRCNINYKLGQLVSIERSPRRKPLGGGGRVGEGVRPTGAARARPKGWAGGLPGLRLPLFQVLPLPARLGIPPKARSW